MAGDRDGPSLIESYGEEAIGMTKSACRNLTPEKGGEKMRERAFARARALVSGCRGKAAMVNAGAGFVIVLMARIIAGAIQGAVGIGGGGGPGVAEINNLFNNLLNIGTGVALAVCAFFIMWGAFLYMTAEGNPARMERG